jgi:hypothetical protein
MLVRSGTKLVRSGTTLVRSGTGRGSSVGSGSSDTTSEITSGISETISGSSETMSGSSETMSGSSEINDGRSSVGSTGLGVTVGVVVPEAGSVTLAPPVGRIPGTVGDGSSGSNTSDIMGTIGSILRSVPLSEVGIVLLSAVVVGEVPIAVVIPTNIPDVGRS